jgi:hypothetical protein
MSQQQDDDQQTNDQQHTGNHQKPGTPQAGAADRIGGTRTGAENVEPADSGKQ